MLFLLFDYYWNQATISEEKKHAVKVLYISFHETYLIPSSKLFQIVYTDAPQIYSVIYRNECIENAHLKLKFGQKSQFLKY